jgi:hypothetical protein
VIPFREGKRKAASIRAILPGQVQGLAPHAIGALRYGGESLSSKRVYRTAASLLFALAITAAGSAPVLAGPKDYRFEIVQQAVWSGSQPALTVKLIHVPSGKPVTDAQVFVRQPAFRGYKGGGVWVERTTPLYPDGRGNYQLFGQIPRGLGATTTVKLGANVPNERGTILAQVTIERG